MIVITIVVRPMSINSPTTLSANVDGLAVVIIMLISLDIVEIASIDLEVCRGFKRSHF